MVTTVPGEKCNFSPMDGCQKDRIAWRAVGSIDLDLSNLFKEAIEA
jgi:hypothetical protein